MSISGGHDSQDQAQNAGQAKGWPCGNLASSSNVPYENCSVHETKPTPNGIRPDSNSFGFFWTPNFKISPSKTTCEGSYQTFDPPG